MKARFMWLITSKYGDSWIVERKIKLSDRYTIQRILVIR